LVDVEHAGALQVRRVLKETEVLNHENLQRPLALHKEGTQARGVAVAHVVVRQLFDNANIVISHGRSVGKTRLSWSRGADFIRVGTVSSVAVAVVDVISALLQFQAKGAERPRGGQGRR
jgi:hypothetical protein